MRESLAFLLEDVGYSVATAADGRQALAWLDASEPPCLILLDLMMPVMDGWQLRAELLKAPRLARIPVVLLSGIADLEAQARSLDAVGYLTKPVDLARVCDLIDAHC